MPKATPSQPTLKQVTEQQIATYGRGSVFSGDKLMEAVRLPFGIFAVDYVTGGGMPVYGSTCVWGPESGGKSTMCLSAMKSVSNFCFRCFRHVLICTCSRPSTRLSAFCVDVEGTMDKEWAQQIGIKLEDLNVALGDYGEMCINMAFEALKATDCGLVIVDSLGALIPEAELDSPMEDQFYAKQAQLISRAVRKLKQRLIKERKLDHPCAVLFVNQIRAKIGSFKGGDQMPGGHAMKHEFSLLLKCVKKYLSVDKDAKYIDKERSVACADRFSVAVQKKKVRTVAGIAEYVRACDYLPELGLTPGQVDDFNVVLDRAKAHGLVEKTNKGWSYFDKNYRVLKDIVDLWKEVPQELVRTKHEIINRAMKDSKEKDEKQRKPTTTTK